MFASLWVILFFTNCRSSATTHTATTTNKPATDTSKTDARKTETTSADSVGVPECDEYIKKYEACLTSITAKAPQAAPGLKTGFEAQRKAFKDAAANPASKSQLPATCKQAIETAKQSTASFACTW